MSKICTCSCLGGKKDFTNKFVLLHLGVQRKRNRQGSLKGLSFRTQPLRMKAISFLFFHTLECHLLNEFGLNQAIVFALLEYFCSKEVAMVLQQYKSQWVYINSDRSFLLSRCYIFTNLFLN